MALPAFIEKAAFAMDTHYPNWRDGNANGQLTCIPPTLDLLKKYIGPVPTVGGPIEQFAAKEFHNFVERVEKGEEDAATAVHAGFKHSHLVEGFDAKKYESKSVLDEVQQMWAEQLSLDKLTTTINCGFLLLDVSSKKMAEAIIGKVYCHVLPYLIILPNKRFLIIVLTTY